jgi:AsmA-like C-terminal region
LPLPLVGGARLDLHLKSNPQASTGLTLEGQIAGINGTANVSIDPSSTHVSGPIKFDTLDAAPLLISLGMPLPDATMKLPVSATASLDANNDVVAVNALDASVLGQKIKGALTYKTSAAKIEGDLKADALSLTAITSLITGPLADPVSGSIWSSSRFSEMGPPPLDAMITLQIDRLDTAFGTKFSKVKTEILWQPDALEFRSIDAQVFDVPFSGSLTLRRQGSLATYLGKIAIKGVALSDLFPRSGLGGSADIQFDGGGSGESLSAFAASLSGGGQLKISGLTVPGFDLAVLANTTRALDGERDPPELKRVTDMVTTGLSSGALQVAELSAPLTASSGVVRFGPLEAHQGTQSLQGNLALDMRNFKIDGRVVIDTKDVPKDWTAPSPQAIITLKGQTTSFIARDVDVTNLTNILTTRAVARELARIEAQESDLRERAFFARRIKVERDLVERAKREAEEARLAEEARKAQEEAETKRILEELKAKELEAQKLNPNQTAPDQATPPVVPTP